jgi:integrase
MTASTRSRRPRGAGMVRNRGTERNPRWFAGYSLSIGGQRRQIARGPFPTKREAEAWLKDELRRKDEGRAIAPTRMTVAELLDEWLASLGEDDLSPNTRSEYARIADNRIRPHVGHIQLRELRPTHVRHMLDELRKPGADLRGRKIGGLSGKRDRPSDRGLSGTTLQHTHSMLVTAISWAVRMQYVAANAAASVARPKRGKSEMSVWDADQLAAFLAGDDRMMPLFRLLAMTGMRRSEALGLMWRDVDLDAATVSVHRRRIRVGSSGVEDREGGKTAAATRVVDLDAATVAVLRRWQTDQKRERLAWPAGAYVETGYLITRADGQPVSPTNVAYAFRRLTRAAGVPTIRLHDLRVRHEAPCSRAG